MKKILIPVDSSDCAKRAIDEGRKFMDAFGAEIVLLYVVGIRIAAQRFSTTVPKPNTTDDPYVAKEKGQAEEMLQSYIDSFGDKKDKVSMMIIHGIVADEIISAINQTDVDFVIMGSHGIGSALYRNLLGSVTNKVLHHAEKPVLVIPECKKE